jgi:hypothetical protein
VAFLEHEDAGSSPGIAVIAENADSTGNGRAERENEPTMTKIPTLESLKSLIPPFVGGSRKEWCRLMGWSPACD